MYRQTSTPRHGWRATVESQGLVYPTTTLEDGTEKPYWFEEAAYVLSEGEVDELERVTEELHEMAVDATRFLVDGGLTRMGLSDDVLGLPPGSVAKAKASLEANPPSIYGRLDLAWAGQQVSASQYQPPKLLEYNADTPTGLVESSVAQWMWLQDVHPERDQFNSLHERLVQAWQGMRRRLADAPVYFAHHQDETSGEEWMTTTYLRDTADQAGLRTASITLGEIGWDFARSCFVGHGDEELRTCFALYPWEQMLAEEFGRDVDPTATAARGTQWIEPLWKVLPSNKAILAVLWHLHPGHPNLLPAYLDSPRDLTDWVAKPLHGREGANIHINAPTAGVVEKRPGSYGREGWCYQQWCPLPDFDGHKLVIGSWLVDGKAAGVGLRESDGWVTDYYARFVPHYMSSDAPSAAQREAWLRE